MLRSFFFFNSCSAASRVSNPSEFSTLSLPSIVLRTYFIFPVLDPSPIATLDSPNIIEFLPIATEFFPSVSAFSPIDTALSNPDIAPLPIAITLLAKALAFLPNAIAFSTGFASNL